MSKYLNLLTDTNQVHILERIKTSSQSEIDELDNQIKGLESTYPGGIKKYIENAKKAIFNSKNNINPYADYTPSVPVGYNLNLFDDEFLEYERIGIEQLEKTCFVLVAGGLGERLGYSSIKIGIQMLLCDGMTYIEYYCVYIKEYEKRVKERLNKEVDIPLIIMTSDDTHINTEKLLNENNNYGLKHVKIVKQEKVPSLINTDCHMGLDEEKLAIETKPHGHGDVHVLLYQSGEVKKWIEEDKRYVFFFQDTNSLCFRTIPSLIGVTHKHGFHMNTLSIPRRPGEAVGALCCLKSVNDNNEITINVEYNQLDALLKDKFNKEGDIPNENGFSYFPGNSNTICFELKHYFTALEKSKGLTPEFINPKYSDPSKTSFKSSARLECMMQDYPLLFSNNEKVGFTTYPTWFSFAPCKNNILDAISKIKSGINGDSAFTVETNIFECNLEILKRLGKISIENEDRKEEVYLTDDFKIVIGPKIVVHPSFAIGIEDYINKIKGKIIMSANSTLYLSGNKACLNKEKIEQIGVLDGVGCLSDNGFKYDHKKYILYKAIGSTDNVGVMEKIRGFKIEKN